MFDRIQKIFLKNMLDRIQKIFIDNHRLVGVPPHLRSYRYLRYTKYVRQNPKDVGQNPKDFYVKYVGQNPKYFYIKYVGGQNPKDFYRQRSYRYLRYIKYV